MRVHHPVSLPPSRRPPPPWWVEPSAMVTIWALLALALLTSWWFDYLFWIVLAVVVVIALAVGALWFLFRFVIPDEPRAEWDEKRVPPPELPPADPIPRVPPEVAELLAVARGFKIHDETVDLLAVAPCAYPDLFPSGVTLRTDAIQGAWVLDVHPETGAWESVYYVTHDPQAVVYKLASLAAYLHDLLHTYRRGVKESRRREHGDGHPHVLPLARKLPVDDDPELAAAIAGAGEHTCVADLRDPEAVPFFRTSIWSAGTVVRRPGPAPIWLLSPASVT